MNSQFWACGHRDVVRKIRAPWEARVSTAGLINRNPMETTGDRTVACRSTERLSPSSIQVLRFMLLDLKSLHIETCSWAASEGRRDKRVNVILAHPGTTVTSKPIGTMLEPVGNCQCNSEVSSI
jgi:hypothetical protein